LRLPLEFTATFAHSYEALPNRDVEAVNQMLDRLEQRHDQADMRQVIHVCQAVLFATPRIYAPEGLHRVTWCYGEPHRPDSIVCITVASVEG
jgi:hypothetical protein